MVLKPHRLTGIADIPLQDRSGGIVPLKIVPEKSSAYFHLKSGKPGHGFVDGPLKKLRVHRLCHHGGKPVQSGVTSALDGRVHHGRVIQMVPRVGSRRFHIFFPPS